MKSLFTALLLLVSLSLFSQPNADDRLRKIRATLTVIEKLYHDYAEKNHFPGYAFGIVVDGQLILSGAEGFTNISGAVKATPASLFRIASMSKSVTAMAYWR